MFVKVQILFCSFFNSCKSKKPISIYDFDGDSFLANSLAVESTPTVIVFKDGVEKERLVGNLTPSHILSHGFNTGIRGNGSAVRVACIRRNTVHP